MKLGIMQPYFFPYLGYYSLIKRTDCFVLLDTVQFMRHGWIERNRILKPGDGWQYIQVPLEKHAMTTPIAQTLVKSQEDWKVKIVRQLDHYKKRAPFYRKTMAVIDNALAIDTNSIVKLNENILRRTCEYLDLPVRLEVFSEMKLPIESVSRPGEWALNISKALGATEYINPPGGIEIFQPQQFQSAGIKLRFLGNNLTPYDQRRNSFEAGLSIVDVMMFNDVADVNALIDDVRLINAT